MNNQLHQGVWGNADFKRRLKKRRAAERRFKLYGISAILVGILFVVSLFFSIAFYGVSAFWQTQVRLEIFVDPAVVTQENIATANYGKLISQALYDQFPNVTQRKEKRKLKSIVSIGGSIILQNVVQSNPTLIGTTQSIWLPVDDEIDMLNKAKVQPNSSASSKGRFTENQASWLDTLKERGLIEKRFNKTYFTAGDSREPELAGLGGALAGSFYTIMVCLLISFPVGAAAACYLEEFAPRNRFTDFIEININNLAAVPSVVFGLLGLAVFINFFGLPRSVPLVGGIVLSLMTIPTIIIAGRAALRAVPDSIREGTLALGASKTQTVIQEVIPLAMPGMLTGTIIGIAQALGETAPLLMIGMVAFIVDIPSGPLDPSTVLPVQIFLWADSPERAFLEKTSGAILILLIFLITLNLVAVLLRRKFERRW